MSEAPRPRQAAVQTLLATGLFDRSLYEAQVGRTFPSEAEAARNYVNGGRRGRLLAHPLVDPLTLPRPIRAALRKRQFQVVADHLRSEGVLADLDDPAVVDTRRAEILRALSVPVDRHEPVAPAWETLAAEAPRRVRGRVSAVVPTWNDAAMTEVAVTRVLENSGDVDIEVVVVDNGSRRDIGGRLSLAFAHDTRVRLELLDHNVGFALGSNIGVAASTGEFVVFLNNDTEVQPGWLAPLVRHLADPTVLGVQPLLLYPDEPSRPLAPSSRSRKDCRATSSWASRPSALQE